MLKPHSLGRNSGIVFACTLLALCACQERNKLSGSDADSGRKLQEDLDELQQTVTTLTRQMMLQQFYVEEQTRANGNSGLKRMRGTSPGTRPYYSSSHVGGSIAAIHDHSDSARTLGMGEIIAVLNGVEFRTRHNDYSLKMKSRTSSEYGATEDIPFPKVPPEVLQHKTVEDQAEELRQWFRAWRDQNYSVRDYRQYFKPVLCYLEGSWTVSDQESIDEPFDSERHHLDASSWHDLQDKIRFTSYAGSKDSLENFAYLPTTIIDLINGSLPVLAQWNYNILCHPLSRDLPLNRLRLVDDLKARMSMGGATLEEYAKKRAARYQVATVDSDYWQEGAKKSGLLDELMAEIPGKDNYPGVINDTLFGDVALPFKNTAETVLNAAYYNRVYRTENAGAMGSKFRQRGFSDDTLYVAQTTQSKVAGLQVTSCSGKECREWHQRWTYAVPLEIIFMTPLSSWNPYDIPYRGSGQSSAGKQIFAGPNGRRNGQKYPDKAYDGINSNVYYMTPVDFFQAEVDSDPADTTQDVTYVLDSAKIIRPVRASGHRIFIPDLKDVGSLRQRYPIMPIHGEGDSVWQELAALTDIVLSPRKYSRMFRDRVSPGEADPDVNTAGGADPNKDTGRIVRVFTTTPSNTDYSSHSHEMTLTQVEYDALEAGNVIPDIITEEANGHSHTLSIYKKGKRYLMKSCDGKMRCFDGHSRQVFSV